MACIAGVVKIVAVSSNSISLPGLPVPAMLKNAVLSDTRLACCMLCVTMTIVYSFFRSWMSSSIAKVEMPWALPQIMVGLNQTIMLSLSMVVIAALVGANGLGVPVVRALNSVNTALGFEAGLVIVVVAIMLDRMLRMERK